MTGLDGVKAATWDLHKHAERSGIIADILAGRASRLGVALLLRNLLPVYQILDASAFGHPGLVRCAAIEADLQVLAPDGELPLLPAGTAYAERVRRAAEGDAATLSAHAYVRYLGDLNGGQAMQRRLTLCLGDTAPALTFHKYPALKDRRAFARDYRQDLDATVRAANFTTIVQEAVAAFEMNILISKAVQEWAAARDRPKAAELGSKS